MDLEQLRQKLIATARLHRPSDQVPYAFEQRIMARLPAVAPFDPWSLWSQTLWRAAGPCVAVMCAVTLWTAVSANRLDTNRSLAADIEATVLAPLSNLEESW